MNLEELKGKSVVELKALLYDINMQIQALNIFGTNVATILDEKMKEPEKPH